MGNSGTKYDAPGGDSSIFGSVCEYDTLSRIRMNYVKSSEFNGFTIGTPCKGFNIRNVNEFTQLFNAHAMKHKTIFKDILDTNVIQDIKFNEYHEYQVIFGDNITQIDKNWHEKVYAALVKHPLMGDSEKINIYTNIHKRSKIEKQLDQLYTGMIRLCGPKRKKNFNPFEETIEIKVKKNSRRTEQIINETLQLEQYLQDLKTMNTNQGSKNEVNSVSVTNASSKGISKVEDAITQCNVMIDQLEEIIAKVITQNENVSQLKQNIVKAVNQNENVIENVSSQELENECERIDKIIQERYNEINKTTCELVINNIEFIQDQAQKMIEHDWKEYNTNIFKQWVLQMMEQFFDTGELNKSLNLQNILLIAKESIAIGAGFNDILASCFLFCENETDAEFQLKLIDCRLNEIPEMSILRSCNVTINELLLTEKLFCNIIFDDNG